MPSEGNVISANVVTGGRGAITISGTTNTVAGNTIGPDESGSFSLGTQAIGIYLLSGAKRNVIGTDGDGQSDNEERNVISEILQRALISAMRKHKTM